MASPKDNLFAVLVHNLPLDCKNDALSLLSDKYLEKVTHDAAGLRLYFKAYNSARQRVIQRKIHIRGSSYTICSLVTNLTLHGIRKYASESTIVDLMSPYGSVIDLYPVEVVTKNGRFETKSMTDDYRIILDVPEIQADFDISSLQLPKFTDLTFRVSFFCRLCRQNGHMQLQCLQYTKCPSQLEPSLQRQRSVEQRKTSGETDRPERLLNRPRRSSEQRGKKQIPIEKNAIKMHLVKVKKEQDFTNNNPLCMKSGFLNEYGVANTCPADCFTFNSGNSEGKDLKCDHLYSQDEHAMCSDILKIKVENTFEEPCCVGEMRNVRNTPSDPFIHKKGVIITQDGPFKECNKRDHEKSSHLVKVKEEKDFTNLSPFFIKSELNPFGTVNTCLSDSCTVKSDYPRSINSKCDHLSNQHEHTERDDRLKIKVEDHFVHPYCISEMPSCRNESSDDVFVYQKDDRFTEDTPVKKYGHDCGGSDKFGKEQHRASNKTHPSKNGNERSKRCKLSYQKIRNLVPPNASVKSTCKLFSIVLDTRTKNISRNTELGLQKLLDWNRNRDEKELKTEDKIFINCLEQYLAKLGRERSRRKGLEEKEKSLHPEDITGVQNSSKAVTKKRSRRQRAMSLSRGIEQIVRKTTGKLPPRLLLNFLQQVRGRKKQLEIAAHFTTDLPALFNQLEKVEKSYYLYGKRGSNEDRDVEFIQRLRKRLMQKHNDREETCIINKKSSSMRQSYSDKSLRKEPMLDNQRNMDYYHQSIEKSIVTKQTETEEDFSEPMRSYVQRRLSNDDQCPRVSRFTAQSSTAEYSGLNPNRQRNSSYKVQCFRRSSTKQSSPEEEPPENFKSVVQNKSRYDNQCRRISNIRKRSISGKNPPENFNVSRSFHDVQTPPQLSEVWRPNTEDDTLEKRDWRFQRNCLRRSSYDTQSRTNEGNFGTFRGNRQGDLPIVIQTTGESTIRRNSSFDEEIPDISTRDLRKILSYVSQSSEKLQFE